MRRTAKFVVHVLVVLACMGAVQNPVQSIPADVVTVISRYSGMMGPDAELRPGAPPAGFPVALIPKGAVANASLVSPTRGTLVVATAASASLTEIERYWDSLSANGWTPQGGSQQRGFVLGIAAIVPTWSFCQGTEFVTLNATPREAGGFHLRMTHVNDPRRGCAGGGMSTLMADISLPRLSPPAGAKAVPSGGFGGGSDTMTTATRLETKLPVREILQHYEQQLTATAWKVAGRAQEGQDMAMARFDVPSKASLPVTAWLTVTRLGDAGDVDVFLRLVRNARDPRMTPPVGGITTGFSPAPPPPVVR